MKGKENKNMSKRNITQIVEQTRQSNNDRYDLKASEIQALFANSGNDPMVAIMNSFTYGFAMGQRQTSRRG